MSIALYAATERITSLKKSDLLAALQRFKHSLEVHKESWVGSLNPKLPDFRTKNLVNIQNQQKELHKLLYVLNPYLTKYSHGRTMHHPATGVTWDIYQSAVGNDQALIKGPSINNSLMELEGIIAVVEGEPEDISAETRAEAQKRAFISHGKDSRALQKVERFVRALGVDPVIVKYEPSKGEALDDLVGEKMGTCDCVIILATKDDCVDGRWQSRPNLMHEIGMGQEELGGRLIYLKELGCDFPSNVSPKVWENFTQENMEDAFQKIAKELCAFKIIG